MQSACTEHLAQIGAHSKLCERERGQIVGKEAQTVEGSRLAGSAVVRRGVVTSAVGSLSKFERPPVVQKAGLLLAVPNK